MRWTALVWGMIALAAMVEVGCSGRPFGCGPETCVGGQVCQTTCFGPATFTCENAPAPCQFSPTCGCLVDAGVAQFDCRELDGGGIVFIKGGCPG